MSDLNIEVEDVNMNSDIVSVAFDGEGRKVPGSKWYVLQVYSGCEKGVMETLKEKIIKEGKEAFFENICVLLKIL